MQNNIHQLGIKLDNIEALNNGTFILIDIRSNSIYEYGSISNAINNPKFEEDLRNNVLDKETYYIIFCEHGIKSKHIAESANEMGYKVNYIIDGYDAYLKKYIEKYSNNNEESLSVNKSRFYREKLFSRFCKAIYDYELISKGDKIAVCISGGKDSMVMAKLFQELKKTNMYEFDLVYLVMDPGYNEINRKLIETNAKRLNIPIQIFNTKIFDTVVNIEDSPCYLCARMRRGFLYNQAKLLGCNKIALGHHFDDVIETTLMGMLWGGQFQAMVPKINSLNFEGMELIRPMYLIREDDIKSWRNTNNLYFIQCACKFTEQNYDINKNEKTESKRLETKNLIKQLKQTNPNIEKNIFSSTKNVNLYTLLGYKVGEKVVDFKDIFEEQKKNNMKLFNSENDRKDQ